MRLRDGLIVAALSPLGVVGGTELANAVPQRALELSFAVVQFVLRRRPRPARPAFVIGPPAV